MRDHNTREVYSTQQHSSSSPAVLTGSGGGVAFLVPGTLFVYVLFCCFCVRTHVRT